MRGFAQDIEPAYGAPVPFERQVVGVVAASNFPEPGFITEVLGKGQAHDPDTVWVVRDKDTLAVAALEELGVEFLRLGLNPYWKNERQVQGPLPQGKRSLPKLVTFDGRRTWRQGEILSCCSMVVVFATPEQGQLKPFFEAAEYNPRVRLIVRGKKKARPRRGRKPVGV